MINSMDYIWDTFSQKNMCFVTTSQLLPDNMLIISVIKFETEGNLSVLNGATLLKQYEINTKLS